MREKYIKILLVYNAIIVQISLILIRAGIAFLNAGQHGVIVKQINEVIAMRTRRNVAGNEGYCPGRYWRTKRIGKGVCAIALENLRVKEFVNMQDSLINLPEACQVETRSYCRYLFLGYRQGSR